MSNLTMMKKLISILLMLLLGVTVSVAAENRAGPNGGRLLETEPVAEFFVNNERKVEISFLDSEMKKMDLGDRSVRATALAPSGRTTLEFDREEKDNTLVSKEALPLGDGYTIVVQVFEAPDARPRNFRIVYQEHACGECALTEYACICGH